MLESLTPARRVAVLGGALGSLLLVLLAAVFAFAPRTGRSSSAGSAEPTRTAAQTSAVAGGVPATGGSPAAPLPSLNPSQSSAVERGIADLTAFPAVTPSTSTRYPAISAGRKTQPDLYAAAFAAQLLTQDYRAPRGELLRWIQSEAALTSEPTIVALIPPELRGKFAVYSAVASVDGNPVVPQPAWDSLARKAAYTTVTVRRVIEPLYWSQAVADGRLTDQGVTQREVDADVTLHSLELGKRRTSVSSVALTINLEGPPSRGGYGFVSVDNYITVKVR
jgi:hypothetical protein